MKVSALRFGMLARAFAILLLMSAPIFQTHAESSPDPAWAIKATSAENYLPAYLANGIVGLRSDPAGLSARKVVLNGLYDRNELGDNPQLIDYFNPVNLQIILPGDRELKFDHDVSNWQQTLNLREAILSTAYDYAGLLKVRTRLLALRNLPAATMAIYEFEAISDLDFTVQSTMSIPDRRSTRGPFPPQLGYSLYRLHTAEKRKAEIPIMSAVFPSLSGTDRLAGASTFYFDGTEPPLTHTRTSEVSQQVSFRVTLKKGEKYSFCLLNAFTHSGFTSDPYHDAVRLCTRDYNLGYRHLLAEHIAAWERIWQSDIVIEGDDEAQLDARRALYSLYSSIRPGLDLSIPPCGLGESAWGGTIFWDAELWMYPPLLVMQPTFAASMVDFRLKTLPQAKRRAALFGYRGAMYPWQSDLQGNECTPVSYKCDINEHHVTADIAIAAWNYYLVTRDQAWLQRHGYPLIQEIADFWVSRATRDEAGRYHINNVIGPDEYHEDVDDSAYTNGAARLVLNAAGKAAKLVEAPANPEWQTVAENLVILQAPEGHTQQFAQYAGDRIKQADVNLLAFPLEVITDPAQIARDLAYYEPRIDPKGPSMSYSVLAAAHARLGETAKAYELFQRAYQPNRMPPFGFISEKPHATINSVFCTGYGGMLQTILFGFAGLKITENGLTQDQPNLPPGWKKLTIKISGKKDIVFVANP